MKKKITNLREKNANDDPQKRPKPIVPANRPIAAQQPSSTAETTQKTPTMIDTKPTLADSFEPQNDATENSRHSTETRGIKGSRTWSTHQRHRGLTRSLPSNNMLMDGSAIEENKLVVVMPNLSQKVFGALPTATSFNSPLAAPSKARRSQRVAPERRNLARPLLKNTLKPMVAQKSSLIPYAHQILTTTIKPITGRAFLLLKSSSKFRSSEFIDSEQQQDQNNNNNNNRWIIVYSTWAEIKKKHARNQGRAWGQLGAGRLADAGSPMEGSPTDDSPTRRFVDKRFADKKWNRMFLNKIK
ncbi:hypothetical protein niasHT_029195 [Heterodera trifolii]|uniref:Uncharacterized protein n=1 Tax=Heterodera trifolii TaxID=157864 RepID=A0ABD2K0J7_9BILA